MFERFTKFIENSAFLTGRHIKVSKVIIMSCFNTPCPYPSVYREKKIILIGTLLFTQNYSNGNLTNKADNCICQFKIRTQIKLREKKSLNKINSLSALDHSSPNYSF